tara:strand:+ start:51 stop:920 length:870 start_codon:yes stop_codon:yes gene_type:complete
MDQLTKGKNIDVSRVGFSAPKVLDNGAKLVYVNYNGGKFCVQTPWMTMPWAMSCFSEGPYPKYSAELSFKGMDDSGKDALELQQFHDKLIELEGKIVDAGVENSVSWFKKKTNSREVIEALFNPIVKVSKDKETGEPNGKYPPTFKAKVPQMNKNWEVKVFNTEGRQYQINDAESGDNLEDILVKYSKVRAIIQCVGLWVASGNFMCQWKLVKAEVDVPGNSGTHDFLPDSDDEDGDSDNQATEDTGNDGPQMLDDSSDEEDDDDQGEPSPEPQPVVKKTVRKKKVAKK